MRIRAQPLLGWANPVSAAAHPMHGCGWRQATDDVVRSHAWLRAGAADEPAWAFPFVAQHPRFAPAPSEREPPCRQTVGSEVRCTAAAQAWPAKKFFDRLTPFTALARFTDRGAVHGDLGLSGCPSIPPRHAKDSHVTSQPDCARLVAGRLLARTHCTAARTITQRVRTTTRASAATTDT